ncbi:hypothetical protein GGI00_003113 [Coemansia sp. RSA 2681]|nr:hypothetical protein GGI00_003113 [Coemansia sp. RSA 2681]
MRLVGLESKFLELEANGTTTFYYAEVPSKDYCNQVIAEINRVHGELDHPFAFCALDETDEEVAKEIARKIAEGVPLEATWCLYENGWPSHGKVLVLQSIVNDGELESWEHVEHNPEPILSNWVVCKNWKIFTQ